MIGKVGDGGRRRQLCQSLQLDFRKPYKPFYNLGVVPTLLLLL
jgi:hypothetical protein